MTRAAPQWRNSFLAFLLLVPAGVAVLFWYASTPRFAARVHRAVVATLERATGGRVEMGGFRWSGRHLTVDIDDLTIHGREAPGQRPYFFVHHLAIEARLISFFLPKVALTSVSAERPVFHLILNPDGSTNQPTPRGAGSRSMPQTLLNLGIGETRVQDGLILLNNRAVPWEMSAGPLALTMRYRGASAGYRAEITANDLTFRLKNAAEAHSRMQAAISLTGSAIRVEALRLRTGNSELIANGQLSDFSDPRWQASLRGSVEAREIGAIFGLDELRDGAARLRIDAHGEPADSGRKFLVAGHVDLRSGAWQASWLRLKHVELHTNLIVDNDQCSLTGFSSVLEDASRISGSLILKHCIGSSKPVVTKTVALAAAAPARSSRLARLNPRRLLSRLHRRPPTMPHPRQPIYQPLDGRIDAQVSGVTLPLILAAVAPRQYWNIGFTTATSGHVTAHWTGNGDGLDVHGDLTMRAPQHLLGSVPVAGSARADYLGDSHRLVIWQANEETPATEVKASGLLTLRTTDPHSALGLNVTGRDLGEFDRLLTVLDLRVTPRSEPHTLPVNLLGHASFHGDIRGSYFALEAVGHLDADRFEMIAAGNAASRLHRLTWDGFHGELAYAPAQLTVRNAELVRGNTAIYTAFHLLPDHVRRDIWTYDRRTYVAATISTQNASLADLASVLGMRQIASGTLDAAAHVEGIAEDLQGTGHAGVKHAVLDGQPVERASVQLAEQGAVFQATKFELAAAGGTATGALTWNASDGTLSGMLSGGHFALDRMPALSTNRIQAAGLLGFQMTAAGTTADPRAHGSFDIQQLALNRQPMGHLHANADLNHRMLSLQSRADLLQAHVAAAGQVELAGNDPAQAQLTFAGFNIEPVLAIFAPTAMTGSSSLDGRITMAGPLRQLSAIRADADLQAFAVNLNHQPVHSAQPVEVSLRNGIVELKQLHLEGPDTDLTAQGTVDLLHQYRLRLNSQGSVDAALLSAIDPGIQATGQLAFALNARGTAGQPNLHGRGRVSHLNIHMRDIPSGLNDMNGEVLFDQDRLVIQQLKGFSGGGELVIRGFAGYRNGAFVDLTAAARNVRIRYPKGVSSSIDARLRLLGNSSSLLLSGEVEMVRFGVGGSLDLASLAGGTGGVSAPADPSSPLNRVRLDIHVTSAPQLGFQNSFASLAGDVNLRVRGTLEDPSVLGRIDITQGSASFAGTQYRLQQGDIVFTNPVTIEPEIDLEASARVQNYDIIISLHGPPGKLDVSYRSEPPLTQADVLALLALGRTNEQAAMYGEQQQANANLTSEALLGGALNAAVSSRVQKLFGVGSVRVDPNFVGTLGQSTARVTVEEQVGRSLTLTFATNVNTTAQQLIQAQYDISRNVSIIAVRDEANVFSMYLQIRGRHR